VNYIEFGVILLIILILLLQLLLRVRGGVIVNSERGGMVRIELVGVELVLEG
jgi:hypothetical protein